LSFPLSLSRSLHLKTALVTVPTTKPVSIRLATSGVQKGTTESNSETETNVITGIEEKGNASHFIEWCPPSVTWHIAFVNSRNRGPVSLGGRTSETFRRCCHREKRQKGDASCYERPGANPMGPTSLLCAQIACLNCHVTLRHFFLFGLSLRHTIERSRLIPFHDIFTDLCVILDLLPPTPSRDGRLSTSSQAPTCPSPPAPGAGR